MEYSRRKLFNQVMIDAKERRGGQETGSDTLLLLSVNDEWYTLVYINYMIKANASNHSAL
uniref:Uncharacterized protein n=1 Tax=Phlebia radiata TaxID=5308 RepID=L8B994_PHLRA|nr:hypothetical protein PRA_mt0156 [Phlebia radiata]CCE89228.1 hypothetical protein PRA_mt0156 [Phlebia radiata]